MKYFSAHLIMCLCFLFSSCEEQKQQTQSNTISVQSQNGKTPAEIVQYYRPLNSVLVHGPIEAKWNGTPVIIAGYEQVYTVTYSEDQQEYKRILIHLFLKNSEMIDLYLVDTIDSDGGDPKIESVFFANADQDTKKEILVIASWHHQHYDVEGTSYSTFVYDDKPDQKTHSLLYLKDISAKLDGGCDCYRADDNNDTAKFKSAGDVKNELLRLGYK